MTQREPDPDRPVPVFTETQPPPPPEPEPASEPEPRPRVSRKLRILLVLVALVGVAGMLIRVPYYAIGPGSTRDVLTIVDVHGTSTYPSKGKLLITTASPSARTLTVWEALGVWVHPSLSTFRQELLVAPDISYEQQQAVNYRDIEESKLDAERAAFAALGKPARDVPGVKVFAVVEGSPADKVLDQGDAVLRVDGKPVDSPEEAQRLLRKHKAGDRATILYRRDGKRATARIAPRVLFPGQPPLFGVHLGPLLRLPYEVTIDTQQIGGPSGGLVFALTIIDLLTPQDLTRGHVVAVTGGIGANGAVGNVGGVDHKVRAAMRDGADVFLVPEESYDLAKRTARPSLRVIPVATLAEALRALRALPPRG